jgi:hypothetical protein
MMVGWNIQVRAERGRATLFAAPLLLFPEETRKILEWSGRRDAF